MKPPEQYNFVGDGRKFKVKLNPNKVLLIKREDSYYIGKDSEQGYDLTELKIKDK